MSEGNERYLLVGYDSASKQVVIKPFNLPNGYQFITYIIRVGKDCGMSLLKNCGLGEIAEHGTYKGKWDGVEEALVLRWVKQNYGRGPRVKAVMRTGLLPPDAFKPYRKDNP